MATFNRYAIFNKALASGLHDFNLDTVKCALLSSSYTPNAATDVSFSALTGEISDANYTAGGFDVSIALAHDTATGKVTLSAGTDPVSLTAAADITNIKYAVLYNSSAGGTNDLIAYWEYSSSGTAVLAGETFEVNFNGATDSKILEIT